MRACTLSMAVLLFSVAANSEESRYAFTQADRLEYQADQSVYLWDLQGWYGSDNQKLWWKLEGAADDESDNDTELQLLYSRPMSAYFDAQFGVRYEDGPGESSLVIGVQGMAPYRFEIDAAAFVTENGDVLLRGEFERDLLLTQRLVLQPRLELNAAMQDVPERAISSGFTDAALELRLRYEMQRKFAPYVGVSWQRTFGDGSRALRAAGLDDEVTTFVVGARFWF